MDPSMARMMMAHQLEGYVRDRNHTIRYLTSARGAELNGKECVVEGHDGEERLFVRLKADGPDGPIYKLKPQNLLSARTRGHQPFPGPPLPDTVVVAELRAAIADENVLGVMEREDVAARVRYVRPYLEQGVAPPPSPCMDPLCPPEELSDLAAFLQKVRMCCSGDNTVDFRRFNAGVVGNGEACAVCMSRLEPEGAALGFPCGHLFHVPCASNWLASNRSCPTCRFELGLPGNEYMHMLCGADRVRVRIREWCISGMCERCQAIHHEADPLLVLQDHEGGRGILLQRSTLG